MSQLVTVEAPCVSLCSHVHVMEPISLCKKDFWLEICFLALAISQSCQSEIAGVECSEEVRGTAKEMPK